MEELCPIVARNRNTGYYEDQSLGYIAFKTIDAAGWYLD